MKTKQIILFAAFLIIGTMAIAQPNPPGSPDGNPVPADNFLFFLVVALVDLGMLKLKNRKN